jgi:hypothetical protein
MSPFDPARAFLQSIMPAPVASRSCLTRAGEIVAAQMQKRTINIFLLLL